MLLALGLLFMFLIVWTVLGFLSVRQGAKEANARLGPRAEAALEPQDGLLLTHPSVILLLGTDHAAYQRARKGFRRSDSIMLIRTDPGRGRIGYHDPARPARRGSRLRLREDQLGHADRRARARDPDDSADRPGGQPRRRRQLRRLQGSDRQGRRRDDRRAGPILSNKFDCPYPTQERCDRWAGWRFAKGKQKMDGRRALIYSRIRENRLNPAESDITRGRRQQDVIQALLGEMASFRVWLKLPFIGDDLMSPLTTDLSAGQFMQLALVQKRSNREVRCRLGGTPQNFGGGSFIQLDEEARRTILAFRGQSARSPRSPARPSARAAGERPLVDPLRAHRRRGGAARRSRAGGIGCLATIAVGIIGALIGGLLGDRVRRRGSLPLGSRAVPARRGRLGDPAARPRGDQRAAALALAVPQIRSRPS